jgi:hypothetical protein
MGVPKLGANASESQLSPPLDQIQPAFSALGQFSFEFRTDSHFRLHPPKPLRHLLCSSADSIPCCLKIAPIVKSFPANLFSVSCNSIYRIRIFCRLSVVRQLNFQRANPLERSLFLHSGIFNINPHFINSGFHFCRY